MCMCTSVHNAQTHSKGPEKAAAPAAPPVAPGRAPRSKKSQRSNTKSTLARQCSYNEQTQPCGNICQHKQENNASVAILAQALWLYTQILCITVVHWTQLFKMADTDVADWGGEDKFMGMALACPWPLQAPHTQLPPCFQDLSAVRGARTVRMYVRQGGKGPEAELKDQDAFGWLTIIWFDDISPDLVFQLEQYTTVQYHWRQNHQEAVSNVQFVSNKCLDIPPDVLRPEAEHVALTTIARYIPSCIFDAIEHMSRIPFNSRKKRRRTEFYKEIWNINPNNTGGNAIVTVINCKQQVRGCSESSASERSKWQTFAKRITDSPSVNEFMWLVPGLSNPEMTTWDALERVGQQIHTKAILDSLQSDDLQSRHALLCTSARRVSNLYLKPFQKSSLKGSNSKRIVWVALESSVNEIKAQQRYHKISAVGTLAYITSETAMGRKLVLHRKISELKDADGNPGPIESSGVLVVVILLADLHEHDFIYTSLAKASEQVRKHMESAVHPLSAKAEHQLLRAWLGLNSESGTPPCLEKIFAADKLDKEKWARLDKDFGVPTSQSQHAVVASLEGCIAFLSDVPGSGKTMWLLKTGVYIATMDENMFVWYVAPTNVMATEAYNVLQTSGCLEEMQVLHLANVVREGQVIDEGAKFLRRAANDDAFDDVIVVRALAKMITALRDALFDARMENTSLCRDLVIVMLFLASLHHLYLDQVKYKCAKQRQVDACKKVRIVGNRFGTF
jgi:hypothetical protein